MSRAMGKDVQAPCQLMGVELVEKKKNKRDWVKRRLEMDFCLLMGNDLLSQYP
jgi:hypothetical protein